MPKAAKRGLGVAAAALCLGLAAQTEATVIASQPGGGGSCTLGPGSGLDGTTCMLVAIDPHPAWQPGDPFGQGAQWVSYADTGVGGSTLAPHKGSATNPDGRQMIMSVTESFVIGLGGGSLYFRIWADDTADVWLDGTLLFAANFTQGTCAAGVIGCEPNEFGEIDIPGLAAGEHVLRFDLYQVGTGTNPNSNPFGMLYSGWVGQAFSATGAAEPASAVLLGLGLAGLGLIAARRH